MSQSRAIVVEAAPRPLLAERETEICEHKGIGHPDTITDAVCEAAAVGLALDYERAFGHVLHFNVDKGLLAAGQSEPRFGGGRIVEPVKLILCGRATDPGGRFDIRDTAIGAARRCLAQRLRAGDEGFLISAEIRPGSADLRRIYGGSRGVPVANDTSFGVGYAPYSPLEQQVLALSAILKSAEFHARFPAGGDDFKIMGQRRGASCVFTLAIAFIDRHVANVPDYFRIKRDIQDYLAPALPDDCRLRINALDEPRATDESGLYLTVSGLSAEMGDDGQVGRGNRANGLITPGRPMSLEAVAGKNPASHVGKIYNVLAREIACDICAQLPAVAEATVQLLSTIGQPIDEPALAIVQVGNAAILNRALQQKIAAIVDRHFDDIDAFIRQLSAGVLWTV